MPYIERRLAFDRKEGALAVCLDDDERTYIFPVGALADIPVGDVFLARIDDESTLTVLDRLEEENARIHESNRTRLKGLFKRSSKDD